MKSHVLVTIEVNIPLQFFMISLIPTGLDSSIHEYPSGNGIVLLVLSREWGNDPQSVIAMKCQVLQLTPEAAAPRSAPRGRLDTRWGSSMVMGVLVNHPYRSDFPF